MMLDHLNNHVAASHLKSDPEIAHLISQIDSHAKPDDLYGEDWILLYEGVRNGWLPNDKMVKDNRHFKILLDNGISFYDPNNDADYQSYDYIESLPYDTYPKEMRKEAKKHRDKAFATIIGQLYAEIDESDELDDDDKDILKEKCKSIIKSQGMKDDIFECILSQLFRRNPIDMDKYVEEVVSEVREMMIY